MSNETEDVECLNPRPPGKYFGPQGWFIATGTFCGCLEKSNPLQRYRPEVQLRPACYWEEEVGFATKRFVRIPAIAMGRKNQ